MTALEIYKNNKSSSKYREITLKLFKFNTKRDLIKKDNIYIFSTNLNDPIGKFHKLSIFYVEKIEGSFIHCYNLLYLEKHYLKDFINNGINSSKLLKYNIFSKIILHTKNIIRSEYLDINNLELLPLLKLELIGIHTNYYLKHNINKIDTANKLVPIKKIAKKQNIESNIIDTKVEDHEIDLDVLFDEGEIKYKEVE